MLIRMAGPGPVEGLFHALRMAELSFAERLTVWSIRLWMLSDQKGKQDRRALIETAYEKTGAASILPSIDGALWPLKIGGRQPFTSHCPCTQTLSDDEIRILHLLACQQAGACPAARPVLNRLAPTTTARVIQRPLSIWATRLESAGLRLPVRDWQLPELLGPVQLDSLLYDPLPAARPN